MVRVSETDAYMRSKEDLNHRMNIWTGNTGPIKYFGLQLQFNIYFCFIFITVKTCLNSNKNYIYESYAHLSVRKVTNK